MIPSSSLAARVLHGSLLLSMLSAAIPQAANGQLASRESRSAATAAQKPRPLTQQREARLAPAAHVTFPKANSEGYFQISGGVFCGGYVALAEQSEGRVPFFEAGGRWVKSVGGIGQGPGEFQRLTWIQRVPSGVVVYDVVSRRLTRYSCDGELVRSWSASAPGAAAASHAVGLLDDGRVVSAGSDRAPPVRAPTSVRTQFTLYVSDLQTSRTERIGNYAGRAMYREPNPRGGEAMTQQVLGAQGVALTDGQRIFVVDGGPGTLGSWGAFETAVQTEQISGAVSKAIDPLLYARAAGIRTAALTAASDRLLTMLQRMPSPEATPALGWYGQHDVSLARMSRVGTLWVTQFGGMLSQTPSWNVLDTQGVLQSRVSAASELDVLDATEEVALVRVWDADDLEHVELRRILWRE